MKRNQSFGLLLVVVAVFVAGVVFQPSQSILGRLSGDAFLDGKPSRYWAGQLSGGPGEQSAALDALKNGGDEATLVIVEVLQSGRVGAEQQAQLITHLGESGATGDEVQQYLLAAVQGDDPHVQYVAAANIPKVGVPTETSLPILIEMLDGPHAAVAARAISVYKGAAASTLPVLIEISQDTDRDTELRWNAVRTIGKIGPDAVSSLPALIDLLTDEEDTIREHAAESIGDIGPTVGEEGVKALMTVMDDPYLKVRRDAVRSLGYIGEASKPAVPQIIELTKDPEELVRDAAKTALQSVDPEAAAKLAEDEEAAAAGDSEATDESASDAP